MSRRWRKEPDPATWVPNPRPNPSGPRATPLIHPLLPDLDEYDCEVSVIMGTYNRLSLLKQCVESVRKACVGVDYEIIVSDGGSNDGTRQWLAAQDDVILLRGSLDGAVKAFNDCFNASRGRFILNLNDDAFLERDAVHNGLRHFKDPMVGQVAFGFSVGRGPVQTLDARGTLYVNYGLTRANVARKVSEICGGFWAPAYYTYGGDTELSMWVVRLGYKVVPDLGAVVRDAHAQDSLRKKNHAVENGRSGHTFRSRWPDKRRLQFRGPEPGVSAPECARLRTVEVGEPPNARWGRLPQVDPAPGKPPPRAPCRPERVLHAWLRTDEDPQQSQHDALCSLGSEGHRAIDWLKSRSSLSRDLVEAARALKPTLVFLQLQGPHVDPQALRALREDPTVVVATWSGDVGHTNGPWPGFQDAWSHAMAREADVMLYTGTGQVQMQRARGMRNAAYLQIGYEESRYRPGNGERNGIVFLGQNYGAQWNNIPDNDAEVRRQMVAEFQQNFANFRAYGTGWRGTALHQSKAGDVLRGASLALSVSLTSKLGRYTSDRMIRSMACGTPTLVKRFADMEGLGLHHGVNVLVWDTVAEAVQLAREWMRPEKREELLALGRNGASLMAAHHTWGVRMQELSAILRALRGNSY